MIEINPPVVYEVTTTTVMSKWFILESTFSILLGKEKIERECVDRVKFSDVLKDLEFKFWMLISRLERFGAMLWIPSLLAVWSIHDHFDSSYLHGLRFGDNKDSGVYQKFWGAGARTTITLVPPPFAPSPAAGPVEIIAVSSLSASQSFRPCKIISCTFCLTPFSPSHKHNSKFTRRYYLLYFIKFSFSPNTIFSSFFILFFTCVTQYSLKPCIIFPEIQYPTLITVTFALLHFFT